MKGVNKQMEVVDTAIYKKITNVDLDNWFKEINISQELHRKERLVQYKKVKNNLKLLREKAIELKKEIPDELNVAIMCDLMMGSWFFEKYKEWFN